MMSNVAVTVFVLMVSVATGFRFRTAQTQAANEDRARLRAEALVKQARAAIGGEEALRNVLTLSASANSRRHVKYVSVQSPKKVMEKEKSLDGSLDLDFAFPDKFRQRVKMETLRGFGYSYAEVVSGDLAWRDPPLRPISSQRDSRLIDVGDAQRTELMVAQGARQQLTFYVFGWLLESLPSFPLDLKYAGQEAIESGGTGKADILIAEGKGGFKFLLLLDGETHLPMALAVPFIESRPPVVIVEAAGYFDRRFMMETFLRARQERRARARPSYQRELQLRFSDRRPVAGLVLPHRITATVDGVIEEEMIFDEIRVNRPIHLKKFAGPPKLKD